MKNYHGRRIENDRKLQEPGRPARHADGGRVGRGPGYLQGGGLCPDPQEGLSNPANRETAHGAKGQTDGLDRPADSRGRGTGVTCVRDVSKHWICATNPLEQGCPPATPGGEEERR